ncbi:MAG: SIS domain-containing protein [Phycisphaerae bacterium]|nr:SIS domain-containing protein [Phycisphaerales bacterium]
MINQIAAHLRAAEKLNECVPLLERICSKIESCFKNGGRLYVLGNGGSAADAQHIAAEMLGRFKIDRQALPTVALTTDSSTLTAIGNDLGGEFVFSRQVEALATDRDIVWALSVSGRSPNVINAVKAARKQGAFVIGFTSLKGDELAEYCDECLRAHATDSDRVQEVHELAYHLICERIESAFADSE